MHQKLSHLTSKQVSELMKRYYEEGEKIASLISDFRLDMNPGTLVGTFSPYIHDDQYCPYCEDQNLISKRLSRDHGIWAVGKPHCPSCNHSERERCSCNNCLKSKERIIQKRNDVKREIIENNYGQYYGPSPDINELSLKDSLYLLSVLRHSLSEDFYSVQPFNDHHLLLAPTYDYLDEITQHLYSKKLISISRDSDINSFVFDDELTKTTGYYPTRVIWEFLPSMLDGEKRMYMRELDTLVKSKKWPASWESGKDSLWRHIAKYECLEYYSYLLKERGYEQEDFGPKTHHVFEVMLERFSVSQIFNMSWQAVRDTTDYIVKKGLPKYHAKNSFIGAIERKSDKALAEGWKVRFSRRDFNCPQTVVSSTFFDVFLGLGQSAFDTVPHTTEKN